MVKVPSEEMLESVLSELQSHASAAHGGENPDSEECEGCQFFAELDKRTEVLSEKYNKGCVVDQIPVDMAPPMISIMVMSYPPLMSFIASVCRMAFFIGYKTGHRESSAEQPKRMIGE